MIDPTEAAEQDSMYGRAGESAPEGADDAWWDEYLEAFSHFEQQQDPYSRRSVEDTFKDKTGQDRTILVPEHNLRRVIRNILEVTNRSSMSLEDNDAIYDAIEQIEHELYKEFNVLVHDDAMERIRKCIEEEYIKAYEEAAAISLRHSDIT